MFGGTSSPGDSISSNPERTALRRRGEDPSRYIEVLPQRAGSLNWCCCCQVASVMSDSVRPHRWQWSLLIKENQVTRVKEFSASLCVGRCRSLDSLKSSLSFAFWPSQASILWFSHPELPWGSQRGVAAVQWLLDPRYSPSWVPSGLTSSPWRTVIADDCDIRVFWYGRKYSISQLRSNKTVVRKTGGARFPSQALIWQPLDY